MAEIAAGKISPCLWFTDNLEEAVDFYISVFGGEVLDVSYYTEEGPGRPGSVISMTWTLAGQRFMGINGGQAPFRFSEALSLFVACETQAESDEYWEKLTADGGEESMCGWLKDRYGVSWQVIPTALFGLIQDPDPERARKAFRAMLGMRRIDIAEIKQAMEA